MQCAMCNVEARRTCSARDLIALSGGNTRITHSETREVDMVDRRLWAVGSLFLLLFLLLPASLIATLFADEAKCQAGKYKC